ncbi:pH-dependent sodium/proton antiporter [Novosphingobium malaysiense]|uniref:Na(+)/H(+) antiporter NhaA n=1 Tax=Novosphingobium malaysiense TaxID=1348853 RepID=A0A0B1ZWS0_9SPHN|nr:pH-dependent sodium/proton antiporter [Novosphingobium malaysiense]
MATNFTKLMGGEASAGILLIIVAALAMIVANAGWAYEYHHLFHGELPWTPIAKLDNLHLWINDALMAIFFFVVGLEIKREILDGELSNAAKRRLPVLAAAAGMGVPALIYLLVAGTGQPMHRGWAIPAATDIAFAVGVLGLLGSRVPASLRLFLLTVAIVDDLGAVAIIAIFYTAQIKLLWGIGALVLLGGLILLNRRKVFFLPAYLLLGLGLWYCILYSGIHATIAGVVFAFTIPLKNSPKGDSMLLRLEHALVPWNSYIIVPLFGFANAGVALGGIGLSGLVDPIPLGVALGLFFGKQIGIFAAIVASDRLGFAPRPAGASWAQLWGTAVLCGIGFTMSLFIGALAFPQHPHLVEEAKLGVLLGSLLSSLLGYAILRLVKAPPAPRPD